MSGTRAAVLVAVAAPLTLVVPLPTALQAVPVLLLLGWAPGHCLAVAPGAFDDTLTRVVVAISVSLAATVVLSTALLYLGLWTAAAVLLSLCAVTLAGALAASVLPRRIGVTL